MLNAKETVKATKTNATCLNVRSSGCSLAHLVTVSDGYVDVTILRLGGKGIELKVMLKPDMPDANWDYLRQVMLVLGMRNIGRVFFALKLKPVRKLAYRDKVSVSETAIGCFESVGRYPTICNDRYA